MSVTATSNSANYYYSGGNVVVDADWTNELVLKFPNNIYKITPSKDKKGLEIYSDRATDYNRLISTGGHGFYGFEGGIHDNMTCSYIRESGFRYSEIPYCKEIETNHPIRDILKRFCKENDVEYKDFGNFQMELHWLTLPLFRFIDKPLTNYIPELIDKSYYLCGSLDDISFKTFGVSTPKLRKILAENIFKQDFIATDRYVDLEGLTIATIEEGIRLGYRGSRALITEKLEGCNFKDNYLAFAKTLTECFGVDKAYNILIKNNKEYADVPFDSYSDVYKSFIQKMGYKYALKMFSDIYAPSAFYDTAWMWEKYREGKIPQKLLDKGYQPIEIPKKCKNFHELHDKIMAKHSILKAVDEYKILQYYKIKKHKVLKILDKQQYNDMKIIFPKDTKDLVLWGKEMSNCISGYFDRVQRDETMVFSLEKDGKMLYNVEVVGETGRINTKGVSYDGLVRFKIKQYMGYGNKSVSEIEKIKLEKFINIKIFRYEQGEKL